MKKALKVELLFITPDAERLIELAGRTAYQSFGKIKKGSHREFVRMLRRSGHHSVLEHAYATFRISGISRACSHQLVRHRLCSFTQKSQRYVDEKNFSYVLPPSIEENSEAKKVFEEFMETAKKTYVRLKELGIKNEDARFVLPNATETEIVLTANFRELRHIISLRKAESAQWEIRKVAEEMLKILKEHAPSVFEDL
ncbi:MAG: FAD-dependent thymidylate synthase [Desulfobacterota bacterium]|nr:FAD-dependent thymidylate synthase [Thermodesulfobacteriota bacterium]MDW8001570.1 FAD-dependent thymidylate synthase [Deltaproteobacteria bacterium]